MYSDNEEIKEKEKKKKKKKKKEPSSFFYYPSHPDILVLKCSDILSLVNPIIDTGGRIYKLSKIEMEKCLKYFSKENLLNMYIKC